MAQLRRKVSIAAAAGIVEADIAALLGVSEQHLNQVFASELRLGRAAIRLAAFEALDAAAASGSAAAAKQLVAETAGSSDAAPTLTADQRRSAEINKRALQIVQGGRQGDR